MDWNKIIRFCIISIFVSGLIYGALILIYLTIKSWLKDNWKYALSETKDEYEIDDKQMRKLGMEEENDLIRSPYY